MCGVITSFVVGAGCGRISFDVLTGDGAAGSGDGTVPDVTMACVADGFCPPSCVGSDPDCATTCGDSTCIGNAGELCTTCSSDCRVEDVCGNAACDPGEDSANCPSDCGPSPWPWISDEMDLLTRVNMARTQGTSCNGMPATTAPAVTIDAGLALAARDLAWEESRYGTLAINRCDGRRMFDYLTSVNATSSKIASGETTNAQRMTQWIATGACTILMNTRSTRIGLAVANDTNPTYVALFR